MPRIGSGAKGMRPGAAGATGPTPRSAASTPTAAATSASSSCPAGAVRLSPRIVRVTADNGSVMTGPGTNSYFVGDPRRRLCADRPRPRRCRARAGAAGRRAGADHAHPRHAHPQGPLARRRRRCARPPARRCSAAWPTHPEWQDAAFRPDTRARARRARWRSGDDCTLRVVHTPGHASNHLCYLLEQEKLLFTGDHLMQGSHRGDQPARRRHGGLPAIAARACSMLDLEWLAPGPRLPDRPAARGGAQAPSRTGCSARPRWSHALRGSAAATSTRCCPSSTATCRRACTRWRRARCGRTC